MEEIQKQCGCGERNARVTDDFRRRHYLGVRDVVEHDLLGVAGGGVAAEPAAGGGRGGRRCGDGDEARRRVGGEEMRDVPFVRHFLDGDLEKIDGGRGGSQRGGGDERAEQRHGGKSTPQIQLTILLPTNSQYEGIQ